jgi:hypothetical protein
MSLTLVTHENYERTLAQWSEHKDYLAEMERRTAKTDDAGRWIDLRGIKVPKGKPVPHTARPRQPRPSLKRPRPTPTMPEPLPREQWPRGVRVIAWFRSKEDEGLGDTIKRQLATLGANWVAAVLKELKIKCGCDARRRWLNARFSYSE